MQAETSGRTSAPLRRMTVRQAAEEWQLNPATIRNAIREGSLPAVWAGNGYRVIGADVEEWVRRTWCRS